MSNQNSPAGTTPIRVQDPFFPDRWHLMAAQDKNFLYLYRRQERRHYKINKAELLGPDLSELVLILDREAKQAGVLPNDIARRLIAGVHQDGEHTRLAKQLKPPADRLDLSLSELAGHLDDMAELVAFIRAEATARRCSVADLMRQTRQAIVNAVLDVKLAPAGS